MATINVSQIIKEELAAAEERIRMRLAGVPAAEVKISAAVSKKAKKVVAAAEKAEKKEKRVGVPTPMADFTKKVMAEHEAEWKAFRDSQETKSGAHLKFVGQYKKDHQEEWEAFQAAWKAEHPSRAASEAGSVGAPEAEEGAPSGEAPAKPKRVLTEEHKRKLAEGRARKAAEKKGVAPALAGGAAAAAALAIAEEAPAAAAEEESDEEGEEEVELLPFTLGAFKYVRPGVRLPNGSIRWVTNDLWENNRGARGDWVGVFDPVHEDIDAAAEEPELDF